MDYVTKSGKVLTEEDVDRLVDEAEAGYDVEAPSERAEDTGGQSF